MQKRERWSSIYSSGLNNGDRSSAITWHFGCWTMVIEQCLPRHCRMHRSVSRDVGIKMVWWRCVHGSSTVSSPYLAEPGLFCMIQLTFFSEVWTHSVMTQGRFLETSKCVIPTCWHAVWKWNGNNANAERGQTKEQRAAANREIQVARWQNKKETRAASLAPKHSWV